MPSSKVLVDPPIWHNHSSVRSLETRDTSVDNRCSKARSALSILLFAQPRHSRDAIMVAGALWRRLELFNYGSCGYRNADC